MDTGGRREEILPIPETQSSFCAFFLCLPEETGDTTLGDFLGLYSGPCLSPTPSASPSPEPLIVVVLGVYCLGVDGGLGSLPGRRIIAVVGMCPVGAGEWHTTTYPGIGGSSQGLPRKHDVNREGLPIRGGLHRQASNIFLLSCATMLMLSHLCQTPILVW